MLPLASPTQSGIDGTGKPRCALDRVVPRNRATAIAIAATPALAGTPILFIVVTLLTVHARRIVQRRLTGVAHFKLRSIA
jgi:hypothetical protein